VAALLLEYAFRASLIHARKELDHPRLLALFQKTCRRVLRALDVEVRLLGRTELLQQKAPFLIIGNHSSYLDMVILGAQYPCLFVSSLERRDDGAIGRLAQLAGTIFVDRQNRTQLRGDIHSIANYLSAGIPLCLYPEGTTSNGRKILPFKSSLLHAIEAKDVEILPVCLRYTHADGKPLAADDFDAIAWYGEMSFFPHFRRLIKFSSIRADLKILDPIRTHGELGRKAIANAARDLIEKAFQAS
jgi:1-acyl-sn-glycerol-3-phosphate acyltransferase